VTIDGDDAVADVVHLPEQPLTPRIELEGEHRTDVSLNTLTKGNRRL
jgi:hypothetical protein